MRFRGTYIIVALAVGLLLFIYFYEIKGGKKREKAEEEAKKVVHVEENAINSIEISRPGQKPLRLEKDKDGDWRLTSPLEARADKSAVEGLTWEIAKMKSGRSVGKVKTDLQPYGLATPEMEVSFKAEGKERSILFGSDTPIGRETYVMVGGSDEVKVVSRSSADTFDTQAADLRDRRVVVFKRDKLVGVELEVASPERKIVLDKADGDWRLSSPKKVDASDSVARGIVDQLSTLEAESFVPQPVAEAQGLGKPDAVVTLILGKQERAAKKVDFYREEKPNKALVHPEGEVWYYRAPAIILGDVEKPVEDFRERKVLDFDRFNLTRIKINKPGADKQVVLKKDDKGDWKLKGAEEEEVSSAGVFDFIDKLEGLKAREFVDNPPPASVTGLDTQPTVVLYGKSDEGEEEGKEEELARLILGGKTGEGLRYAKGSGEQVFLISASFNVPATAEDFTEKSPAPPVKSFTPMPGRMPGK